MPSNSTLSGMKGGMITIILGIAGINYETIERVLDF